ncbi:hypothetical protein [Agromyces seonyuensis]|uniref:DUF4337 domain-containing protein n=1 Tax=Agromyces seonyuensis TaxID=2662446 RepID=A0A6I4P4E3_9MICO|nr:hypothetical protein [Agromyces seonyuensis]MWB99159.1 hypothetical protein [Agromyces seonyuensis]
MSDSQPAPARPGGGIRERLIDGLAVFLLSAIAVLTAWCGFQSSKWGGEMSIAFSEASSARVQATDAASSARDARSADTALWTQWILATSQDDAALVGYIEARFSPELAVAFEAWDAEGRTAAGPFAMAEYVPPGTERAAELNARADQRFADALENNQRGDNYSILTVLFALVLFLTAMSQREMVRWGKFTLLGLSVVAAVVGIVILATFPIRI